MRPSLQIVTELNTDEFKPFILTGEAAELGFPIGVVPGRLETTLGNKHPFILESWDENRFCYKQALGVFKLTVFND